MLVAIDGSESGFHALKESFRLAVNEKSWITVLSVVPRYEGDLDMVGVGNVLQAMRQPCEAALAKAAELAKEARALIKTVCEEGVPYEKIVDLADAGNCELIVMGRRGLKNLERSLLGSVTARVIGLSRKDVLVIPLGAGVAWKNIMVAVDGSVFSANTAERAMDFAASYGGELKVLSVVDVPAEFYGEAPQVVEDLVGKAHGYVDAVRKKAEDRGLRTETFVMEGDAHASILELAGRLNINTIVMGSHGRTGLKRLLMGSVAEKVIGYARCPVLVVKA